VHIMSEVLWQSVHTNTRKAHIPDNSPLVHKHLRYHAKSSTSRDNPDSGSGGSDLTINKF